MTSDPASKLALLDVDGTLTEVTSIWQYLLEACGRWQPGGEVNLARFQAGRISYEEFCDLDAGLLAGESYARLSRTAAGVPLRQGVEALFCHLSASGYRIALISTGLRLLTNHLAMRFPVDLCVANDLAADGDLCTGAAVIEIGENEKGKHAQRAIELFRADHVIAVGDSVGDLPMFALADRSFAVGQADQRVVASADAHIADSDLSAICTLL